MSDSLQDYMLNIIQKLVDKQAPLRVFLKNNTIVDGSLIHVDNNFNLTLSQAKLSLAERVTNYDRLFIRGSSLKYFEYKESDFNPKIIETTWKQLV